MPGLVYPCVSNVQERCKKELGHCFLSRSLPFARARKMCARIIQKRLTVVSVIREAPGGSSGWYWFFPHLSSAASLLDESGFSCELLAPYWTPFFEQSCPGSQM